MRENKNLQKIMAGLNEFKGMILGLIILSVICSALTSYVFTKPVYQATAQILVHQNMEGDVRMDKWALKAESLAILTYSDMIKSPIILEQVKERLNIDYSAAQLKEKIEISFVNNSQVFNLTVKDQDPEKAAAIANAASELFIATVYEVRKADNIKILSAAEMGENPAPVDSGALMKMGMAAFLALAAGGGLKLCISSLDSKINDDEDIQELLETPVIGLISFIPEDKEGKIVQLPLK